MYYPAAVHIDKVKTYNVDQNSENANDRLILKKIVPDKKKRRVYEEKLPITCDKVFAVSASRTFLMWT